MLIGVIADTHGLVRPEVRKLFLNVNLIVHAGDIGTPDVLETLNKFAPVRTVRGNVDKGEWTASLHETEVVEVAGRFLFILHDLNSLDLDPVAAGMQVVISGHSHKASISTKNGVLYLNPGSSGPRRFKLSITAALLEINSPDDITVELHTLDDGTWVRSETWP
jgi:uncharacterized protein